MARTHQNEALLEDRAPSPLPTPMTFSPDPSNPSQAAQTQGSRTGYSRVTNYDSTQPSPAFSSSSFPSPAFQKQDETTDLQFMRQKDGKIKKRVRRLKFVVRTLTLIMAVYSLVSMADTLHRYYSTRYHEATIYNSAGQGVTRGPWATESKTWPTLLLLIMSCITLILDLTILAAYLRSIHTANKTSTYFAYVGYVITATHVGIWIPTAAAYRAGKDGHDLWGWSCAGKAQQIQPAFKDVVDFEHYCRVQTAAWASSLAEAVLVISNLILWVWEYRRLKHQREMQSRWTGEFSVRESRWSKMVPTGHTINT